MPAKRIVACLDVKDGRVVKGVRFEGLRDAGDPAACAKRYCAEGIDEIVMLDVSATLEGRLASLHAVEAISDAIDVPLTAGGGIRCAEDAMRLLDAGADKVALNSAATRDPELLRGLSLRYGSQCVVLSIDARRRGHGYEVATRSGTMATGRDALQWAREACAIGAGEILITAIDRDGTRSGYDLALIAALSQAVSVPVVASGGARDAQCFARALLAGADAALAASVFHDGNLTVRDVKQWCNMRGLEIRW